METSSFIISDNLAVCVQQQLAAVENAFIGPILSAADPGTRISSESFEC